MSDFLMFLLNLMLCVLRSFQVPCIFSEKINVSGNIHVYLLRKNDSSIKTITLRLVSNPALFLTKGEILDCVMQMWMSESIRKTYNYVCKIVCVYTHTHTNINLFTQPFQRKN